jgi:hypothetical protein
MDTGNIANSVARGYFIAATMKLLFNKNKNPLNMETLQQGGKIAAADFAYNGFVQPMMAPFIQLPRTS